jgi:hypothetical protein
LQVATTIADAATNTGGAARENTGGTARENSFLMGGIGAPVLGDGVGGGLLVEESWSVAARTPSLAPYPCMLPIASALLLRYRQPVGYWRTLLYSVHRLHQAGAFSGAIDSEIGALVHHPLRESAGNPQAGAMH